MLADGDAHAVARERADDQPGLLERRGDLERALAGKTIPEFAPGDTVIVTHGEKLHIGQPVTAA